MKKTILFISTKPKGFSPIDEHEEEKIILEAWAKSANRDDFVVVPKHGVTKEHLIHLLANHKPYIIHISAHGDNKLIYFQHKDGYEEKVHIDVLYNLLEDFTTNLKAIVLNACYSHQEIETASTSINFIIGMTNKVTNKSAKIFSLSFYEMLFSGKSIPFSFSFAKKSLGLTNKREKDVPILIENYSLNMNSEINEEDISSSNEHYLHQFPRGPMVEGHLVKYEIIKMFAKLVPSGSELMYVNMANSLRLEADNDDKVRVIEAFNLPSPKFANSLNFWNAAFGQARLNGPRMLVALLNVLPDEQFDERTKNIKNTLIEKLKS